MLILLQFPFADLRQVSAADVGPSIGPDWGIAPNALEPEFLRGFGKLRMRGTYSRGSGTTWPSEGWFADAASGIRFPELKAHRFFSVPQVASVKRAVRRVFSDGGVLWRVEVGVSLTIRESLDVKEVAATVNDFLRLPVRIRRRGLWSEPAPLIEQGYALGLAITEATTKLLTDDTGPSDDPGTSDDPTTSRLALRRGRPMVLVEASKPDWWTSAKPITPADGSLHVHIEGEAATKADSGEVAPLRTRGQEAPTSPVDVRVATLRASGHELPLVWVHTSLRSPTRRANAVRVGLFRLHAEREALTVVLRALHSGRLSEVGSNLERYLAKAEKTLFAAQRSGGDHGVLSPVFSAYDSYTAVELKALEDRLADRQQTRKRTLRLANSFTGPDGRTLIVVEDGGTVEMSTYNVDARNNSGQLNIGGTFINNGTIISGIGDSKIKEATETLNRLAEQLSAKLPDEADKESVATQAEALVKQAASKKHNPDLMKISGKGLIDAAKSVAEMAGPITVAVKAVLGLFGIAL